VALDRTEDRRTPTEYDDVRHCKPDVEIAKMGSSIGCKRWGVMTIGTGLGNARFTNRKADAEASRTGAGMPTR
jgi:hypothetical protein